MKRQPGWRSRLDHVLDEYRYTELRFGVFDCGILVMRCAEAICGSIPVPGSWRTYRSEAEAIEMMQLHGFENIADMVGDILPEIEPSTATHGDVAAIERADSPFGYALGIVNGQTILVLHEKKGLGLVSLLSAKRAFKIG